MELTREMLVIEFRKCGQECVDCPLNGDKTGNSCTTACSNEKKIREEISKEFKCYPLPFCYFHSIQLKPEYNGLD